MSVSPHKTVVLGVTGSIAAHKAVDIASQLTKQGCCVRTVLTADAQRFLTPLPFKTLTRQRVVTDLYDEEEGWQPVHIKWADEADLMLVAPATANCIAKLACGLADDPLSCIALALNPSARLLIAPAMNGKMWQHPATQENLKRLTHRGVQIIGPDTGLLSCGYEGIGRLEPVENIVATTLAALGITHHITETSRPRKRSARNRPS
jgi:phosphopantothenoylcysteine decarboxylase